MRMKKRQRNLHLLPHRQRSGRRCLSSLSSANSRVLKADAGRDCKSHGSWSSQCRCDMRYRETADTQFRYPKHLPELSPAHDARASAGRQISLHFPVSRLPPARPHKFPCRHGHDRCFAASEAVSVIEPSRRWIEDEDLLLLAMKRQESGPSRLVIGRGDYHWQHEPAWYAVRKGNTGHWAGDRKQTTVWGISHLKSETGHGTQKPVECMKKTDRE
jgi:hypothetical protein